MMSQYNKLLLSYTLSKFAADGQPEELKPIVLETPAEEYFFKGLTPREITMLSESMVFPLAQFGGAYNAYIAGFNRIRTAPLTLPQKGVLFSVLDAQYGTDARRFMRAADTIKRFMGMGRMVLAYENAQGVLFPEAIKALKNTTDLKTFSRPDIAIMYLDGYHNTRFAEDAAGPMKVNYLNNAKFLLSERDIKGPEDFVRFNKYKDIYKVSSLFNTYYRNYVDNIVSSPYVDPETKQRMLNIFYNEKLPEAIEAYTRLLKMAKEDTGIAGLSINPYYLFSDDELNDFKTIIEQVRNKESVFEGIYPSERLSNAVSNMMKELKTAGPEFSKDIIVEEVPKQTESEKQAPAQEAKPASQPSDAKPTPATPPAPQSPSVLPAPLVPPPLDSTQPILVMQQPSSEPPKPELTSPEFSQDQGQRTEGLASATMNVVNNLRKPTSSKTPYYNRSYFDITPEFEKHLANVGAFSEPVYRPGAPKPEGGNLIYMRNA